MRKSQLKATGMTVVSERERGEGMIGGLGLFLEDKVADSRCWCFRCFFFAFLEIKLRASSI